MGRPLNKKLFGDPSTAGNQFNIEAWIPGGTGVVSAWILRQKTNNIYIVTDSSNTGRCQLQKETITAEGQMRMFVMPFGFDQATAAATMKAIGNVSISSSGTNYVPGNTVTLTGGTFSTAVDVVVNSVRADTVIVVDAGTGSTPGNILTVVGGIGEGSTTFTVVSSLPVDSVVSAAGTNYVPGEVITLAGGSFSEVATVVVDNVASESGTVNVAGSGYSTSDTVIITGGTGTDPTFDVDTVKAVSVSSASDGSGYLVNDVLIVTGGTGTAPTFTIITTKGVSATVADQGAGYSVANTLTVSGGTQTGQAIFNIDTVGTVSSQDETDFDGVSLNGTFVGGDGAAGTAHVALDVLTMSDGSTVRVDTVDGNDDVLTFTILATSTGGLAVDNSVLTQTGSTGTGTLFALTLGIANQSVFTVSFNFGGNYTVEPANDVTTTTNGSGQFALLTVLYGVRTISLTTAGDYSDEPTNPADTSGGFGTGATVTVTYGVLTVIPNVFGDLTVIPSNPAVTGGGSGSGLTIDVIYDILDASPTGDGVYTTLPGNPVAQEGSSSGSGTNATFIMDWGVNFVSLLSTPSFSSVPPNSVITTGGGGDATFDIGWNITFAVLGTPGDYSVVPTDPVEQGSTTGIGTGAAFILDWSVLDVNIVDSGGGYVTPPSVTFIGGSVNATGTAVLTTVGGSTPPDESVASITVNTLGSGYSATAVIAITIPLGDVEYIRILNAHQVKTFEGNVYSWGEFLADKLNQADLDLT